VPAPVIPVPSASVVVPPPLPLPETRDTNSLLSLEYGRGKGGGGGSLVNTQPVSGSSPAPDVIPPPELPLDTHEYHMDVLCYRNLEGDYYIPGITITFSEDTEEFLSTLTLATQYGVPTHIDPHTYTLLLQPTLIEETPDTPILLTLTRARVGFLPQVLEMNEGLGIACPKTHDEY
jgi:hypothetical protein